jgi:hypothetical protein
MAAKIIKFLGIVILSFFLFSPSFLAEKEKHVKHYAAQSDSYIYITVFENGKWITYVYESDGVTLVTIIEEEW